MNFRAIALDASCVPNRSIKSDWLLSDDATQNVLGGVAQGVTPEMAAAVSKIAVLKIY